LKALVPNNKLPQNGAGAATVATKEGAGTAAKLRLIEKKSAIWYSLQ